MKNNSYIEDALKENEIKINYIVSFISLAISFICIVFLFLLNDIAITEDDVIKIPLIILLVILIIGPIVNFIFKGRKPWLKYLIFFCFVLSTSCGITFLESGVSIVLMLIPVISSCMYYHPKFSLFVCIFSMISFIAFSYINAYYLLIYPDLNFITLQDGASATISGYLYYLVSELPINKDAYFSEYAKYLLLPVSTLFIIITYACYTITKRGRILFTEQVETVLERSKINNELNLASSIQKNMLPSTDMNEEKFVINSYLLPAKAVGGDLYDFFRINDSKVALVVADVSDKGIPASLFMTRCKTLISASVMVGDTLVDSINYVNKELCKNNANNMFATAFACVIDTNTGEAECVNAGHCVPVLINDGKSIFLDVEADLFLGAMDDISYTAHRFNINLNGKLILYTDGITEAFNKKVC